MTRPTASVATVASDTTGPPTLDGRAGHDAQNEADDGDDSKRLAVRETEPQTRRAPHRDERSDHNRSAEDDRAGGRPYRAPAELVVPPRRRHRPEDDPDGRKQWRRA